MIDNIAFENRVYSNTSGYNLNSVVNGVGCALTDFSVHVDVRHNQQDLPGSPGLVPTTFSMGRMVIDMEGDVMHNTPTGYWTERMLLAKQFITGGSPSILGELRLTLTGVPENLEADCHLVGYPEIPIGLLGATISSWRISLGVNDPWFRGANENYQSIPFNAATALTAFGPGNAPSWPRFIITGPITNPNILWQGLTILSFNYVLAAGNTITINMRDRSVKMGAVNLYDKVTANYGWVNLDPRTVPVSGKNVQLTGSATTAATKLEVYYYNNYVI